MAQGKLISELPSIERVRDDGLLFIDQDYSTGNASISQVINDLGLITKDALLLSSSANKIGVSGGSTIQSELNDIKKAIAELRDAITSLQQR